MGKRGRFSSRFVDGPCGVHIGSLSCIGVVIFSFSCCYFHDHAERAKKIVIANPYFWIALSSSSVALLCESLV